MEARTAKAVRVTCTVVAQLMSTLQVVMICQNTNMVQRIQRWANLTQNQISTAKNLPEQTKIKQKTAINGQQRPKPAEKKLT